MKYSLSGTSIIESMIVLLVVVTGITGIYGLLVSSQKLANSTSDRIEAIQIARDGLEAFTNIRDTNWILYAADYENCWNVLNDNDCIGISGETNDIRHDINEGFNIYRNSENKFRLALVSYAAGETYADSSYRSSFEVRKESLNGFYTQSGGLVYGVGSDPFYTREIQVDYLDNSGVSLLGLASDNDRMRVTVIVQWNDVAKQAPQKLEMSTVLTNWKAKK